MDAATGCSPADLAGRRVLLVVSGGIAAYKSLELIRLLAARDCAVSCVLTAGGAEFVTALSLQALTGKPVHAGLFSLTEESEMGHIALSRSADLIVVCPASANILAAMAAGLSHDLATTLLLATDAPVLVAPAMNVRMWDHPATRANLSLLRSRGIHVVGPEEGVMACNEFGYGRLAEPPAILAAIASLLSPPDEAHPGLLAGRHALVTAGPTHEPIDAVRYIANVSSGKQGYAIAGALAALGARVTLVSGPVALPAPAGCQRIMVDTAEAMRAACEAALPADIAVLAAAVGDWRVESVAASKLKKRPGEPPPTLKLVANPDILALLSQPGPRRPRLVVGFAAETTDVVAEAIAKRQRKGCDWILANDVSEATGIMGGDENEIHLITGADIEAWPLLPKKAVAERLALRIATEIEHHQRTEPKP